jgi:hypothetical protein
MLETIMVIGSTVPKEFSLAVSSDVAESSIVTEGTEVVSLELLLSSPPQLAKRRAVKAIGAARSRVSVFFIPVSMTRLYSEKRSGRRFLLKK